MGMRALSFKVATDQCARCTGKPHCGARLKAAANRGRQALDLVCRQRIDSRYGIRDPTVRTDRGAATMGQRAALYLRVSTDGQTTENQRLVLAEVAGHRG